jgi:CheY-like chemotaxis protein
MAINLGAVTMTTAGRQILLAEDDRAVREAVSDVLRDEGYVVTLATDGKDALERLRTQPLPELLLLDLMMPVMTGWQLLQVLQADPLLRSLPVLVFSAAAKTNAVPGAKEVLSKPLRLTSLLAAIERNLP